MTSARTTRQERGSRLWSLTVIGALAVAVLGSNPSRAGFSARVNDTASQAVSRPYFTCVNAATANPAGTPAYAVYPFNDLSGIVARDVSGNVVNGTYSPTGVVLGTTTGGVCPRDFARAVTLDGVSGFINCANSTVLSPQIFTLEIWFRTSNSAGRLFGLSGSGLSLTDRAIYIGASGRLRFGVNTGLTTATMHTIASPSTVTSGTWHFAAAELSVSGMALYLDGNLAASDPAVTSGVSSLVSATPFWRVGFDSLTGWPDAPSSSYFRGDLAFASVYASALNSAQILAQYQAGIS